MSACSSRVRVWTWVHVLGHTGVREGERACVGARLTTAERTDDLTGVAGMACADEAAREQIRVRVRVHKIVQALTRLGGESFPWQRCLGCGRRNDDEVWLEMAKGPTLSLPA
jgi:hypothetical protein